MLSASHVRQRAYANEYLNDFEHHFMFWSPIVRPRLVPPSKQLGRFAAAQTGRAVFPHPAFTKTLSSEWRRKGFINDQYAAAVDRLREKARTSTADTNNPAFRVLQILERLRRA
jgi:hypothetical protein